MWGHFTCRVLTKCTMLDFCRKFTSCHILLKDAHNKLKLKGRKKSSQEWLARQLADPYVKWAKVDQYRCRSAFKLLEIDERVQLLRPGMCVVDCGAAPGSWTQVLVKKCNAAGLDADKPQGLVIAVDQNNLLPVEGATVLASCDFTLKETQDRIKDLLTKQGGADAVVSDMAPLATGVKSLDHEAISTLAYCALRFSLVVSRVGASFLVKLWDGRLTPTLQADISKFYDKVRVIKPAASRSDSAELFLFASKFKGIK